MFYHTYCNKRNNVSTVTTVTNITNVITELRNNRNYCNNHDNITTVPSVNPTTLVIWIFSYLHYIVNLLHTTLYAVYLSWSAVLEYYKILDKIFVCLQWLRRSFIKPETKKDDIIRIISSWA